MEEILAIIFAFVAIFILWCLCDISSECSDTEEKMREDNKND